MKRRILPIRVIIGVLALGMLSSISPALAQAPDMTINTVTPSTVLNTVSNTLMITGSNFVAPVRVEVLSSGFGLFDATIGGSGITFVLPAGFPANTYTLRVYNGDLDPPQNTTNTLTVVSPTATPSPSITPVPGPTNTPPPTSFVRPMVTVFSYGASSAKLSPGQDFEMEMTLQNTGQITASNIVANFPAGDFVPRASGGVKAVGDLGPGQSTRFNQFFTATNELASKKVGIMEVKVSYTDIYGTGYSETFTLTFPVAGWGGGGGSATATPTISPRPQLIISGYHADVEMLQPGTDFTLELEVLNVGSSTAKAVSAIVGGGRVESSSGGTPGAGGVSASSGEFTNFAPVGSSNIQVLGDMEAGASRKVSQKLIVNVSTSPGAYPLKVSFIYADERNANFTDDQVITLLVYKMASVDVTFYRPLDPFYVGQPGVLPLQVANLGRSSAVLGNMTVTAGDAEMMNNTLIVGNVDPGFPVTLDAMVTPTQSGKLEVSITIEYTDDFNKVRTITKTLEVEVLAAPEMGPGMNGNTGEFNPPTLAPETLMQVIWRFIRGFIGLDSARTDTGSQSFEGMPVEGVPSEGVPPAGVPTELPQKVVPAPGGNG